jgi:hypothetical protein
MKDPNTPTTIVSMNMTRSPEDRIREESQPKMVPMASHAAMLLGSMMLSGFTAKLRQCHSSCALHALSGSFIGYHGFADVFQESASLVSLPCLRSSRECR